jgi:hypothetical protein
MKSVAKTTPTSPPLRAKSARSPSKPLPPATIFLNIPTGSPPDHRLPPNQPSRGIYYSWSAQPSANACFSCSPAANTTCSAATKPDRANTILINTRNGEPLLALIGHEFGHKLRAQRPDLYRAFSRLALATNPVPFNYRAQNIAQLYPANRIADEWVNDIIAARFDDKI